MEEWVGLKWHEYVTRQAMGEFPEHTVHLKDEARTLGCCSGPWAATRL